MIDFAVYQLSLARAVDGDTVAAYLTEDRPVGYGLRQRIYSGDENGPAEASIRLPWLNTPEMNRGDVYSREQARAAKVQAAAWLRDSVGLRVVIMGSGGLGRLLGDVQNAAGQSLSQYMLKQGWPAWLG